MGIKGILSKQNPEDEEFLKKKHDFESRFYRLMFELGEYNKFNKTYILDIVEETEYGFFARVYLEAGLSFEALRKQQGVIQENLRCIWIMKTEQFQEYAEVKVIAYPHDKNIPYVAPKVLPNEMYLGLDLSLKPIILDVNKYCMMLFSGGTGSGKTRALYAILLPWVVHCTPQEVELYISDIAKDEYVAWKDVAHCRFYCSELEELYTMMMYLNEKLIQRKHIISKLREKGLATNIEEYNKVSKVKLSYCFILVDEFSVAMPDKTDTKDEATMKEQCLDVLKKIEKIGRGLGLFNLKATQKVTKDEIPSIFRNMSAVRFSLRANDTVSSEIIMGDHSAVGLADRYAVYSKNGGSIKDYLFMPNLTTEMMMDLLKPHMVKNRIRPSIEHEAKQDQKWEVHMNVKLKDPKKIRPERILPPPTQRKGDNLIDY